MMKTFRTFCFHWNYSGSLNSSRHSNQIGGILVKSNRISGTHFFMIIYSVDVRYEKFEIWNHSLSLSLNNANRWNICGPFSRVLRPGALKNLPNHEAYTNVITFDRTDTCGSLIVKLNPLATLKRESLEPSEIQSLNF